MAKAIDELHRLADGLGGHSLWSVLDIESAEKWGAEPGGEKLHDRLRSIADRIEREHAEELETKDAEIEQLREDLAERHELTAEAALRELADELCDGGKWAYGRFEIANRIRNAIEGAPKPDTDREAAADWVDEQGGIDVARDYPKMDGFVATLANDLGVSDDVGCGDDLREAVKSELDRRLMPPGLEWPRFEDGEKLTADNAPKDVFSVCLGLNGKCFALLENIPLFDDGCVMLADVGERIDLPEPEVLGADGLPIKVGDTVNNDYTNHAVAEVHASGAPSGGYCPWVRYTDGEWDFANSVTHGVIDTQERIDEDATMPPREYYAKYIGHDVGLKDDAECTEAMVRHLLNRQRELDAKTMGGAR